MKCPARRLIEIPLLHGTLLTVARSIFCRGGRSSARVSGSGPPAARFQFHRSMGHYSDPKTFWIFPPLRDTIALTGPSWIEMPQFYGTLRWLTLGIMLPMLSAKLSVSGESALIRNRGYSRASE